MSKGQVLIEPKKIPIMPVSNTTYDSGNTSIMQLPGVKSQILDSDQISNTNESVTDSVARKKVNYKKYGLKDYNSMKNQNLKMGGLGANIGGEVW